MPQRDIGTLTEGLLGDYQINLYYFAKIVGGGETLRYSQWPDDTFTLDITDGDGAQSWTGGKVDLQVERVSQSNQSLLDVSSMSFANVYDAGAGPWTTRQLANTLQGREVTISMCWWPKDSSVLADFIDRYILFRGRIGMVELNERANISLVPFRASWNLKTGRLIGPKCSYVHMYGDPESCQFAGDFGTFPTCDGTEAACIERGNQANFGGFPLAPKPNTVVVWGGKQRFTV